jgi:hypothetical protein
MRSQPGAGAAAGEVAQQPVDDRGAIQQALACGKMASSDRDHQLSFELGQGTACEMEKL